jgi:hypothetical protein
MIPFFVHAPIVDGDMIGHCIMPDGNTVCGTFVGTIYTGEGHRWPRSDNMMLCTVCGSRLRNLFESPIVGKWSWTHP